MTRSGSPVDSWKPLRRTVAAGIAVAMLTAVGGRVLERQRFGATDQESFTRIEQELRRRVDATTTALATLASRVAASSELIHSAARDKTSAQDLFEILDEAVASAGGPSAGITVHDAAGSPVAWSGRVSDIERQRIEGPAVVFVAPGAFGPFLVRVEPVANPEHPTGPRLGTIVAEQLLGEPQGAPGDDRFVFSGSLAPVSLTTSVSPRPPPDEYSFVIPSGGQLLVEAHVDPGDISAARARWRARVRAAIYAWSALTLLACAAPFAALSRRARSRRELAAALSVLVAILVGARLLLRLAVEALLPPTSLFAPELLLNALLFMALVALAFDVIERWRVTPPRRPLLPPGPASTMRMVIVHAAAGAIDLALLWNYERFLQQVVSTSTVDLLRFSLLPISAARFAILFGLLLLHATVIWSGALVIRLASVAWRMRHVNTEQAIAMGSWIAGVALGLLAARRLSAGLHPVPSVPLLVALAATVVCAAALARPRGPIRRASQFARLFGLYVALLVPALAMYPSLHAFATQAKEELVAGTFGPQAANIREELQRQLNEALAEINARQGLELLLEGMPEADAPMTDQAYAVWSDTVLKQSRLTSAVELYGAGGRLVSRFALNLPEDATSPSVATDCTPGSDEPPPWDVIEEASIFLRASRAVCSRTGRLGAVVVRVMLDYRTLPFIASASPYLESFRTSPEGAPGRDVEFAVYGWSRAPIYMDGTTVWQLPDPVFQRMVDSRMPFWETLPRRDQEFRVYFLNDRGGIYALGYPIITLFGHLMNLAELVVLAGVLYVLLLAGSSMFSALTSTWPATGRALLREVRSSFYRKVFLAFVAVAIVPATILAVATRSRLVNQFASSINDDAIKTATVAQRLVEDYGATLQQPGARGLDALDDQTLMFVERAIAQDVNLFNGPTLQATSERDLFASHLFSTRTPANVYRRIALDRMPTFVNVEDERGFEYLLAAAPVRAADREGPRIVTIPLTLRQRELDLQRDDLDRRVVSAFVLFVLLGAGLGYWMAERIADPVNRLTRATRRIARGDLDARIAATSSDELGRLVEDFNHMAADLKRQRAELERTQRLEAWADMARQVAHDVKNPLTPIQLSAEHALRINADRGRPLSPVLEECVTSILSQVRLLREISAEFSSFASSPTARPESTDLAALIEEVVEPYRTGLSGRIAIDVQAHPELPLVTLDRTLFARALTNIMENALHAMPGQGRLTITSRVTPESDPAAGARQAVVVTVADTGVGMDHEALARIFEPYFSTKASGTGLGLTIAKRNVELIGGTIGVESQRGVGTTVTIRFTKAFTPLDQTGPA